MTSSRKLCLAFLGCILVISACTNSVAPTVSTRTLPPNATEKPSEQSSPVPSLSSLKVEKEALRGKQVTVWHPWFGAQASLFESQVAKFNTENEWGIVVRAEGKSSYAELFAQTNVVLEEKTNPNVVIALPEHAFGWSDHVVDLNVYVNDPLYGLSANDILDFPPVIWDHDTVEGKRFSIPAQRTARFLLYNQTWA